jgi:acyl carrier protein
MNETASVIASYLSEACQIVFGDGVDADSDLFQLGLLDSHGYLAFIRFAERQFDIQFEPDEILLNVVVSPAGMADLVEAKLAQRGPARGDIPH